MVILWGGEWFCFFSSAFDGPLLFMIRYCSLLSFVLSLIFAHSDFSTMFFIQKRSKKDEEKITFVVWLLLGFIEVDLVFICCFHLRLNPSHSRLSSYVSSILCVCRATPRHAMQRQVTFLLSGVNTTKARLTDRLLHLFTEYTGSISLSVSVLSLCVYWV